MPADARTFHRKWGHLARPHVRALAWLLDSPDLLDPDSPHWQGKIATLGPITPAVANWLDDLDADPSLLDAALGNRFYSRLGLYAEKLMAFYFAQQGTLAAHGLQVRDGKNGTIGESTSSCARRAGNTCATSNSPPSFTCSTATRITAITTASSAPISPIRLA